LGKKTFTFEYHSIFVVISLPIDCTFENGWCNFFHDDTANFEWERTNTGSMSLNTGPGFGIKKEKSIFLY
jgi:hypothetical protein